MIYLENYFRYMVYEDPTWNSMTANVDDALKRADAKTAEALNSTNPDLSHFAARGGKLIMYHGWNDPAISPMNSINYYNSVVRQMGAAAAAGVARLYMAPGVDHCAGGAGPSAFGQLGIAGATATDFPMFSALEQWVEKGTAPGEIVATKFGPERKVLMTRPLCAYPQIAKYKGSGDTNDAVNFDCR